MPGVIDHANLSLKLDILQLSALDLASAVYPITQDWSIFLSNGTGANQASQVWSDTRTLGASATENLDLAGGLTNAFGVALTFTKLKGIFIRAASANTNNVQVTRPVSNGVPIFMAGGDGIELTPGARWSAIWPNLAGITVTASTGDLITVTNSAGGTSVTYDIILVGVD